jgi:hypothetical protein
LTPKNAKFYNKFRYKNLNFKKNKKLNHCFWVCRLWIQQWALWYRLYLLPTGVNFEHPMAGSLPLHQHLNDFG